jgi:hypothetical protein
MARPKKQDTTTATTEAAAPSAPNAAADAFAKVEPELASLSAEALAPVTVDVGAAVASVLAAAPRLREHREAVVEQLPHHPLWALDKLEMYAQAAWYAHLLHSYSHSSPENAKALLDEATRLRESLLIAAEALAHRNLLDADTVARIRKSLAQVDLSGDLLALAALFRESWGKISSKTAVEKSEIDRAAELGPAVLVASAARKHKSTDTEAQRARAFALLVNAYDLCRQALTYLRWKEGDVDTLAPSLFKKRPGRKPGAKKDEEGAAPEGHEAHEGEAGEAHEA